MASLPFSAWKPDERLKEILNILLRDYDSMRAEIRTVMGTHEKASFWLSSGLIVAVAACFKPEFNIGFAFVPLVILAYYAHRLHRHTLHIAQLSRWIMRTEDLVDMLLEVDGLLEWERVFVRQRLKSFSVASIASSHYFAEMFLLLPSLVVFGVCIYRGAPPLAEELNVPPAIAKFVVWGVYPLLLVLLFGFFVAASGSTKLDQARKENVEKVYRSVVQHPSWNSVNNGNKNQSPKNESYRDRDAHH